MSDDPAPELRELAAKLFAAGRGERPAPALGRRLLLLEPPSIERPSAERELQLAGQIAPGGSGSGAEEPAAASRRRPRAAPAGLAFWLAAAAALSAGISAWLALEPEVSRVPISAEQTALAPRTFELGTRESRALEPRSDEPRSDEPPVLESLAREGRRRTANAPHSEASTSRPAAKARLPIASRPGPKAPPRANTPHAPTATSPVPTTASDATSRATEPKAAAPATTPSVAGRQMTLGEELELLERARSALRSGEAARALELLERHARERSGRGLVAEETLLRIETYAALGRHVEASELAARFVRDNPNSALGDRAKSFIRRAAPMPRMP